MRRLLERSQPEAKIDEEVLRFRWKKSPLDPNWAMSVVEATEKTGREQIMAIILEEGGETVRTTHIEVGTSQNARIEVRLSEGERWVGLVHTHPPVDTGMWFSAQDLNQAAKLQTESKLFRMYLVQPRGPDGVFGVRVHDGTANMIFDLP